MPSVVGVPEITPFARARPGGSEPPGRTDQVSELTCEPFERRQVGHEHRLKRRGVRRSDRRVRRQRVRGDLQTCENRERELTVCRRITGTVADQLEPRVPRSRRGRRAADEATRRNGDPGGSEPTGISELVGRTSAVGFELNRVRRPHTALGADEQRVPVWTWRAVVEGHRVCGRRGQTSHNRHEEDHDREPEGPFTRDRHAAAEASRRLGYRSVRDVGWRDATGGGHEHTCPGAPHRA